MTKRLSQYSQHFLRSPRLVKELVGHTSIKRTDLVYDIGAGSGVIASVLAGRCNEVVAVEAEPRTAAKLRANMNKHPNVTVYEGDFLAMPLPTRPYKIFANIPFHLSSPILRRLVEADHPPQAMYMIVQKQFADKLVIDSDKFTGQLGAYIAPWFAVRIRKRLQRTDFWPHPNVDTVLVEIKVRQDSLLPKAKMPEYGSFIADCFSTPRLFQKTPRHKIGVPLDAKPSQLSTEQWTSLFRLQRTDEGRG